MSPVWPLTLALNAKTAGLVGGGVLLVSAGAYGLGYWKGSSRAAAAPQVSETQTDVSKTAEQTREKQSDSKAQAEESIDEVRTTAPAVVLADGSTQVRTRVERRVAREESINTSESSQSQVHEKIVEKRVVVPCPGGAAPALFTNPFAPPADKRWMLGAGAARDFSVDKTVFGGSLALRLVGPVWVRIAADTHPQVGVSGEVAF